MLEYDGDDLSREQYEEIEVSDLIKSRPFEERFTCSCGYLSGYDIRGIRCDKCGTCVRYGGLGDEINNPIKTLLNQRSGIKPKDFREFINGKNKEE